MLCRTVQSVIHINKRTGQWISSVVREKVVLVTSKTLICSGGKLVKSWNWQIPSRLSGHAWQCCFWTAIMNSNRKALNFWVWKMVESWEQWTVWFSPGNASSREFQMGQVYKNPGWNDTKEYLLTSSIIKIQSALVGTICFVCAVYFPCLCCS